MSSFGLWYARGPYGEHAEAIPSSAFSKGDILCYDSNSSLSRMPATFPGTLPLAGVALSASTASINNKVVYLIPDADTVFWSDATAGSQFTPGEAFDFEYTGGRFFLSTSQNTAIGVVQPPGTSGTGDQSIRSRVQVKLSRVTRNRVQAHS